MSVRGDVLALLRRMSDRLRALGPEAVNGLLTEGFQQRDFAVDLGVRRVGRDGMRRLIDRAIGRGEIPDRTFCDRVLSLPIDLVRHEVLLSNAPLSPATMKEIVDEIFL